MAKKLKAQSEIVYGAVYYHFQKIPRKLLYVGITAAPFDIQHQHGRPYDLSDRPPEHSKVLQKLKKNGNLLIEVVPFKGTRSALFDKEKREIKRLKPIYNRTHNKDNPRAVKGRKKPKKNHSELLVLSIIVVVLILILRSM